MSSNEEAVPPIVVTPGQASTPTHQDIISSAGAEAALPTITATVVASPAGESTLVASTHSAGAPAAAPTPTDGSAVPADAAEAPSTADANRSRPRLNPTVDITTDKAVPFAETYRPAAKAAEAG